MDAAAHTILSKRSKWIQKMVKIDELRITFKTKIFEAQRIHSLQILQREIVAAIEEIEQQWT